MSEPSYSGRKPRPRKDRHQSPVCVGLLGSPPGINLSSIERKRIVKRLAETLLSNYARSPGAIPKPGIKALRFPSLPALITIQTELRNRIIGVLKLPSPIGFPKRPYPSKPYPSGDQVLFTGMLSTPSRTARFGPARILCDSGPAKGWER